MFTLLICMQYMDMHIYYDIYDSHIFCMVHMHSADVQFEI